jgi:hypothetical protein
MARNALTSKHADSARSFRLAANQPCSGLVSTAYLLDEVPFERTIEHAIYPDVSSRRIEKLADFKALLPRQRDPCWTIYS